MEDQELASRLVEEKERYHNDFKKDLIQLVGDRVDQYLDQLASVAKTMADTVEELRFAEILPDKKTLKYALKHTLLEEVAASMNEHIDRKYDSGPLSASVPSETAPTSTAIPGVSSGSGLSSQQPTNPALDGVLINPEPVQHLREAGMDV
ncbi:hypothetical protein B0T26DRAFT_679204 [Lasiosphaeria miniovina]|uniref:Uncharacterized protein n=1 Tax=Lasiosphaeria miniovina TaxID=1954250 RepID=A0AA40A5Y9_9PEZI|nr:uncharacterized protein B0T26DRAFT_679204 [Lasiosphaeria miniovina]KAK0709840.1 hypothetical protein B0T26DRAFT_679204 [Lasiosphaeria miniovina]